MDIICCYIKEQFFIDHSHFVKMLDPGNTDKQSRRAHLCVRITSNGNAFYIPLRNNLGADVRKFGRIGHAVPANGRPAAGIDYRYALIVNDAKYIEIPTAQRIPNSQYQKLIADYSTIETEFEQYLNGFLKAARKHRIDRESLYKESSLVNFLDELGMPDTKA